MPEARSLVTGTPANTIVSTTAREPLQKPAPSGSQQLTVTHAQQHLKAGGRTGKQQEEEVKAAVVEVLGQPVAAERVGDVGDGQHDSAGQVRANGHAEQLQRHGARPHHVRRLVIEELQLPDGRQYLRAHAPSSAQQCHVPMQQERPSLRHLESLDRAMVRAPDAKGLDLKTYS